MKIQELMDILQAMDPEKEAFVVLFKADGTAEVFEIEEVGPATRGSRVVSRASTRVIFGRMAVSCRASLDVPATGGPKITRDELLCGMKVQSTFLKTGRV